MAVVESGVAAGLGGEAPGPAPYQPGGARPAVAFLRRSVGSRKQGVETPRPPRGRRKE